MESEKVKEIKKALEYCSNGCDCECYRNNNGKNYDDCKNELLLVTLDLINELESENEELAKQCVEWSELDFKKRNKIKELKDRIAELEKEKTEQLKQFAERLKNMHKHNKTYVVSLVTVFYNIDETLKEFIKN